MCERQQIIELAGKDQEAWTLPVYPWARQLRGPVVCPQCLHLNRRIFPHAVDVFLAQLDKGTSYSTVAHIGLAVIHQSLLEWLRPHLPPHSLGRCSWKDGSELAEYRSIYFRDAVNLRAGSDSTNYNYYQCQRCGRISAFSDETYVLRAEMPDAEVFQDDGRRLYISESLARGFPWRRFRDLRPIEFAILDDPLPDDSVPVRPYVPPDESEAVQTAPLDTGPAFVPEPEFDPELKAMAPEFPRLADDSPASCPVPMRRIMEYLRLEGCSRLKTRDLRFVRTATIGDHACWMWRFEEQVRADAYVTVWRLPGGGFCLGYRSNTDDLTPEQYIYDEYHKFP